MISNTLRGVHREIPKPFGHVKPSPNKRGDGLQRLRHVALLVPLPSRPAANQQQMVFVVRMGPIEFGMQNVRISRRSDVAVFLAHEQDMRATERVVGYSCLRGYRFEADACSFPKPFIHQRYDVIY